MIGFIKRIWRKIRGSLNKVLKVVFRTGLKYLFNELWEITVNLVDKLNGTNLPNEDKFKKAVELVKKEAKEKALYYRDNWIGIIILLAVEYLKKRG